MNHDILAESLFKLHFTGNIRKPRYFEGESMRIQWSMISGEYVPFSPVMCGTKDQRPDWLLRGQKWPHWGQRIHGFSAMDWRPMWQVQQMEICDSMSHIYIYMYLYVYIYMYIYNRFLSLLFFLKNVYNSIIIYTHTTHYDSIQFIYGYLFMKIFTFIHTYMYTQHMYM